MNIELAGPWDAAEAGDFLRTSTLPVRLSAIAEDGYPRVISLWYQYQNETLMSVTHQSSKLVAILERNQRVGFEISPDSPPYHGIRGQGTAKLQPLGKDPALRQLLLRYVGGLETEFAQWLLSRSDEELLITITPHRFFSWDYRERMDGIEAATR